jgi:DNA-binding response OmpR family regulator
LSPARNHCRKQGYDVSRILIAEDEARIASFVEKGLRAAGFAVAVTADGREALAQAQTGQFDLVILDVGLPGRDGFEILQTLRGEANPIAVIMLTARDSAADTLHGLEGGADDYMSKPFRFDELLARVRLRLKDAQPGPAAVLQVRGLELDLKTRRISVDGTWHDLSGREFALGEEFLRHPDQVLSREQLLSRVWGLDFDPGSNVVEVYVRYLRAKIGANRIETIRGMGYRLK